MAGDENQKATVNRDLSVVLVSIYILPENVRLMSIIETVEKSLKPHIHL